MHVDRMVVREQDLQLTQRIVATGRLAHIDRLSCHQSISLEDDLRPRIGHFIAETIEIARVLPQLRQHFVDDDRAPERPNRD